MTKKIEHIGIAVKDADQAIARYTAMLGAPPYKEEEVPSEGVRTIFFRVGETKIELLVALGPESPIARFIDRRGEGIHHIAFAVKDIHAEMERYRAAGYTLLNEAPKHGADDKKICFIHPKSTGGVLIELCMDA